MGFASSVVCLKSPTHHTASLYAYMCMCIHAYVHTCVIACMCIRVCAYHVNYYAYVCTGMLLCVYVDVHKHTCVCMLMCICL